MGGTIFGDKNIERKNQKGIGILLRQTAQHSVHPTGGSLRVFRQFSWLEVGSVKMALSRPAHQRVTHTVRQHASFFGGSVCVKLASYKCWFSASCPHSLSASSLFISDECASLKS